jgi:hypothetical protein
MLSETRCPGCQALEEISQGNSFDDYGEKSHKDRLNVRGQNPRFSAILKQLPSLFPTFSCFSKKQSHNIWIGNKQCLKVSSVSICMYYGAARKDLPCNISGSTK